MAKVSAKIVDAAHHFAHHLGGHDVDASVPASNDFLGKRTAPYLSATAVVTLTR